MIFATVPSWAKTMSVMPPTYSLSSAPNVSAAAGFRRGGETGEVGEDGGALAPMHFHAVAFALGGEPGGDLRRKIPRQRGVGALGLGLAAARLAHHFDMADGLVDGHFEVA